MVRDQGMQRAPGSASAASWLRARPPAIRRPVKCIDVGAEVEGFAVGDRVACAGAGIANHAEFIDVPVNLAVHVPDGAEPAMTPAP